MTEETKITGPAAEQAADTAKTKAELLAAMNKDFATGVQNIYVNSVGREYAFSEVNAQDQKTLTRVMAGNGQRKDIIYDAQCALINKCALDKNFDIYGFSEFDRIKILMALYQENMFSNEVTFKCQECGADNRYRINFEKALAKLDEYNLEKKTFEYENRRFKYSFELEYPTVHTVSQFHKSYCQRHGVNVPKRQEKANDTMTNLEYVNLFVKTVRYQPKQGGAENFIDFSNYRVSDIEDIMAAFPQDVLYSNNGVVKFIADNFLAPVNESFDKHTCYSCGTVHEKEGTNNVQGFF